MDLSGKGICDDEIASIIPLRIKEGKNGRGSFLSRRMSVSETIRHVQKNTICGTLDLSNNYIYNDGAIQILIAINKIDSVTTIDLSSNRITDANIDEFIPVLLETLKTKKIILFNNPIYDYIKLNQLTDVEE